jgi:uncharacterized protein YkwD
MSLRTRRTSVVITAVALALALVAGGCTKNAQATESARLVNNERARRGLRHLALDVNLVNKAQAWAEHMARSGKVSHSVLRQVNGRWSYLAENVGWARSPGEMHSLFMNSAAHRASILSGRYTKVGTGVAVRNGRHYVVQVFGA